MKDAQPKAYFTLAFVDPENDTLLAVGSLLLEHKFIRNLGTAGHIEDIAVDKSMQGKGVGKKLINALTLLSESLGAYKVILDCSMDNKGRYGERQAMREQLLSCPYSYYHGPPPPSFFPASSEPGFYEKCGCVYMIDTKQGKSKSKSLQPHR